MAGEAIFIGYRRDDTADVAGRIYDAMAARFGKNRVFKDVDNIGPGVDFGDYIKSVLPKCRVALMLIGPGWLASKDEDGRRRLDDAHDWVRIEIETALATPGVLTVPVLVNGARMPRASEVPASLAPLLRRNAAIIRRDPDFHDDVERLAAALRGSVSTGILDLSKLGGERGAAVSSPARGGGGRAAAGGGGALRWLAPAAVAAAVLAGVLLWHPWSALGPPASSPAETTDVQIPLPEMVRIAGGSFMMGESGSQRQVSIAAFEAGKYDVTFDQYDACSNAGACPRAADPSWGRHGDHPVVNVSWNDAQAYVRWLSGQTHRTYRLLTEAEWEYAARAGTTTAYYWGDDVGSNHANCAACGSQWDNRSTSPVGSFAPNRFGLYDMAGNVWQWVQDCDDSACSVRVLRGGSWDLNPEGLRSAGRHYKLPSFRSYDVGFRVARTL
jgi:formylglycine-generating enzyme required for sulfatase activity